MAGGAQGAPAGEDRVGRNIGVGCFTAFIGAASGSMTGVLVGRIADYFTRCEPLAGLPACDWHLYAGAGALVGALTLPTLALLRLRRRDRVEDGLSDRG
jgi:hypothetical protein